MVLVITSNAYIYQATTLHTLNYIMYICQLCLNKVGGGERKHTPKRWNSKKFSLFSQVTIDEVIPSPSFGRESWYVAQASLNLMSTHLPSLLSAEL